MSKYKGIPLKKLQCANNITSCISSNERGECYVIGISIKYLNVECSGAMQIPTIEYIQEQVSKLNTIAEKFNLDYCFNKQLNNLYFIIL
jgi:hypothetical protein